jgi:signal transduction histidine kinase
MRPSADSLALRLLLALLLLAAALAAQGQTRLEFHEALSAVGDSAAFPAAGAARIVALPDEWARSRPGSGGPVWYRIAFDAQGAWNNGELLGLYVERACSAIEVQLNGQRVYLGGRLAPPPSRLCQRPQLVALPAALLRAGANTVDIKVVGYPLAALASRQRAGGLSALQLGRYGELQAQHARRQAVQVMLPQIASTALLLTGAFMLLLGGMRREHAHLAYYGLFAIGWGLVGARLWWAELPVDGHTADLLLVAFMPLVVAATVLFVLRYAGIAGPRWIDLALAAQCLVVPATLLLAGPQRLFTVASGWYALFVLQIALAVALHLRVLWRHQRRRFAPMATLMLGGLLLLLAELAAQRYAAPAAWVVLPQLAIAAAIVAMGLYLLREHRQVLQRVEADRHTLEGRVREATAQIERNFAQLAELRVEQVTQQERKRIAADLHDDLGAKLLTIVHTSADDRIAALAREALDEMRLSVRGLTGKPVRLTDALADWRAEAVSRLAQTGIEAEWHGAVDDDGPRLSARVYVQTTRILREAINNILKHSGATRCMLRASLDGTGFALTIQDNGRGIPLALDGRLDRGHGMTSMKHRAKQMHGQCLVESGPGLGTVIRLTLPLEPPLPAA